MRERTDTPEGKDWRNLENGGSGRWNVALT